MPFKDILVHVDNNERCAGRLRVAAALATAHSAHLIGLYVRSEPNVPQFVRSQYGPQVAALQQQFATEAREQAQRIFEQTLRASGVNTEWRAAQGELYDLIALNARYADLTVVGQRDPRNDDDWPVADHLVLDAGRPVLVVPCAAPPRLAFDTVVVAWNGSREATRAVNDALPMLQQAQRVVVLAANPHGGIDGHGELPGADLALHLARHGVKAEAQQSVAHERNAGELLLARCADEKADVLVMGAYGRSRVRELVLGGATRHVLDHTTIPVLMSH